MITTVPFSIYDTATGVVIRSGRCQELDLQNQVQEGESIITQSAVPGSQMVVNGQIQDYVSPFDLAAAKALLLERLATRRWEEETGGIGAIATDDRSKLLITDAARRAEADPTFTTKWKTHAGWIELDAPNIISIRDAVFQYVADCFAREAALSEMVEAATEETLEALKATVEQFSP